MTLMLENTRCQLINEVLNFMTIYFVDRRKTRKWLIKAIYRGRKSLQEGDLLTSRILCDLLNIWVLGRWLIVGASGNLQDDQWVIYFAKSEFECQTWTCWLTFSRYWKYVDFSKALRFWHRAVYIAWRFWRLCRSLINSSIITCKLLFKCSQSACFVGLMARFYALLAQLIIQIRFQWALIDQQTK